MKLLFFILTMTSVLTKAYADYANINDLKMYYEIHGSAEGVPLVLLHGGGSTIETSWGRMIPLLKSSRKIIAIEEQAHGRTGDRGTPVRFESTADDVAALMKHLKLEKIDVMGFSNGGSVAMQVAIRHPKLVRKMIFASSLTKKSGVPKGFWKMFDAEDFTKLPQPYKDAFLKVTPDQEKLMNMYKHDFNRMKNFKDVSDKDVKNLKADTLVIQGQHDVATLEHAIWISRTIPKAKLIVLPGGHGEYLGEILSPTINSKVAEATALLLEEFLGK